MFSVRGFLECSSMLFSLQFFSLILELVFSYHEPELVTAPQGDAYRDQYEYILYEKDVTWNDAVRICGQSGARILTIQSQKKEDLIQEFKQDVWPTFASHDYWAGLAEPEEGVYVWSDCTKSVSYTHQKFKGESYNSGELCYRVHKDNLEWESRNCDEKNHFACERVIPGACDNTNVLSSNKLHTHLNMSRSECKANCSSDPSCWAGISIDSGRCILLQSREWTEPLDDVIMFQKTCTTVSFVSADNVPVLPYEDKEKIPLLNCSTYIEPDIPPGFTLGNTQDVTTGTTDSSTITGTTPFDSTEIPTEDTTTPSLDISPSPCISYLENNITNYINETVTVSIFETWTYNETLTFSTTQIVVVSLTVPTTPTSSVQAITSTDNVHDVITYTQNVTQYITQTSVFTETVTIGNCLATNNTYTSPNDPLLLQAIASMQSELTVNKKTTSSALRRLTSAKDSRPSSKAIGGFGVAIIVIILSLVILSDMSMFFRATKKDLNRFRNSNSFSRGPSP